VATRSERRRSAVRAALSAAAKALSHETRVDILTYLTERSTGSVSEIARHYDEPMSNVGHHMQQLADWGFVEVVDERAVKKGTAEKIYRAAERPLLTDEDLQLLPGVARQGFAGQILEESFGDVADGFSRGAFDRTDWHLTRTLFQLDEQGWLEMRRLHDETLERAMKISEGSAARLASGEEQPLRVSSSQLCFVLPDR
jgi:DNA-binding transcriptional ArsR family regulator